MTLTNVLKDAAIADLNKCEAIYLSIPSVSDYFRRNHDTLNLLYENKILTNEDIDSVLENKIIAEAKIYTRIMRCSKEKYADHVLRPEFLAYAIEKKELSNNQLLKINFDHGDTLETYVKQYHKPKLVENLRKNLLNPEPTNTVSTSLPSDVFDYHDMEHPVCSCGN